MLINRAVRQLLWWPLHCGCATIRMADSAPVRPSSSVPANADGTSATMPEKMISEIPLPTPRLVICSPSHIKNVVPATREIVVIILNEIPDTVNIWMLATGTAIGPYLSILKTKASWNKFEKVILENQFLICDIITLIIILLLILGSGLHHAMNEAGGHHPLHQTKQEGISNCQMLRSSQ